MTTVWWLITIQNVFIYSLDRVADQGETLIVKCDALQTLVERLGSDEAYDDLQILWTKKLAGSEIRTNIYNSWSIETAPGYSVSSTLFHLNVTAIDFEKKASVEFKCNAIADLAEFYNFVNVTRAFAPHKIENINVTTSESTHRCFPVSGG